MKAYSPRKRLLARNLRHSSTDAELRLWQALRSRAGTGYKFRRQHPIGPYIVDFVCLERKWVIEVDGGQHLEQIDYDARRTRFLESLGYSVTRFFDRDVLTKTDSVLQSIFEALRSPSP